MVLRKSCQEAKATTSTQDIRSEKIFDYKTYMTTTGLHSCRNVESTARSACEKAVP
jgi:hypothetical protein